MSASNPMGEWVDSHPAPEIDPVPARSLTMRSLPADEDGHWLMSSFDLLSGVEVTENPDTVPGELFDELFLPKQDTAKRPR
jgi:hypothetical protein